MALSTEDDSDSMLRIFSAADYAVLALLLLVCVGVGIYHGFFARKVTTEDYLIGGRNMKLLPTSLSLIVTLLSGTAIIGVPADVYLNGVQFSYCILSFLLIAAVASTAILPVFHELQITSAYEYLQMRFHKSVRYLISVFFLIRMVISLPRYIYTPAVVLNQVTGQNLHYGSALLSVVCIFYTCVGGFKAVAWTDVIQSVFVYTSMMIIIKGTIDIGGPGVVFERSVAGQRLQAPALDVDPTVTYTLWSVTVGIFCTDLLMNTFNQTKTQRYLSLPNLRDVKRAVWIVAIGECLLFISFSTYFGLLIYATFYDCDPITTKVAKGKDQVVPLFVMMVLGPYPGLPGIFVAGVSSAAVSTVSSSLNAMSAVVLDDFCKILIKKPLTERQRSIIMKIVVVVSGAIGGALVYVVDNLGTIMQITLTIGTLTDGPTLGVFIMGLFLPWTNIQGVLAGGFSGLAFVMWIVFGSRAAVASGRLRYQNKPLSVEGCSGNFPIPTRNLTIPDNSDVFIMYRLSFLWNVPIACVLTILVGLVVSFLTGANDITKLDRKLLSPLIRKYLPKHNSVAEDGSLNGYKPVELHIIPSGMSADDKGNCLLSKEEESS